MSLILSCVLEHKTDSLSFYMDIIPHYLVINVSENKELVQTFEILQRYKIGSAFIAGEYPVDLPRGMNGSTLSVKPVQILCGLDAGSDLFL